MSKNISIWLTIVILLGGSATVWAISKLVQDREGFSHTVDSITSPLGFDVPEFTLTDSNGQDFSSSELKGQVYLASFFFSSCPSVCRLQNQQIQKLCQKFGPHGVKFLSITCDPNTDTPEVLQYYAKSLSANTNQWKFLTGDLAEIKKVARDSFRLAIAQKTHSVRLILVDGTGTMRGGFVASEKLQVEKLMAMITQLLQEQTSAATNDTQE